jgi:outer membrane lipoprotein-sorting protein
LYYSQHLWDKAEQNFAHALACDPDYAKAHFNMAAVNYRKHNFITAYRQYREAKKKYPEAYRERKNSKRPKEDLSFIDKNSGLIPREDREEKTAAAVSEPAGASADMIIDRARSAAGNITSLTGRLTKKTTMGSNTMESISKFYYRFPDKCRIETLEPTTAVLIANRDSVWFYSPQTKTAQKVDTLKQYVNDFLPIFPLRMITAEFTLKRLTDYDGCYILEACPRKTSRVLSRALLKIDPRNYTVMAVELYDPKGNLISQTKYEDITKESDVFIPHKIMTQVQSSGDYAKEELFLSRLSVNGSLDEELFRYEPSKETAVLDPVTSNTNERR